MNSGGAGEELAGGVPVGAPVEVVPVGMTGREEVDDWVSVGSGALVGSLVLEEVRVMPSFSAQVSGSMPCSLLVLSSFVVGQVEGYAHQDSSDPAADRKCRRDRPLCSFVSIRGDGGMQAHTSSIGTASVATGRAVADVASSTHRPVRWTTRGGVRNERLVLALAEDMAKLQGVVGDNGLGSQKRAEGNDGGVHLLNE